MKERKSISDTDMDSLGAVGTCAKIDKFLSHTKERTRMSSLQRLSVSLDSDLVSRFDAKTKADGCPTRSKAIGDLIRACLVETEWMSGEDVAGAIVMVYDHHKPDLSGKLTAVQHDFHHTILSSQHVHLDHDNCLEIVAVRGRPRDVEALLARLKAVKGLKHVALAAGTTGTRLR